MKLKISKLFIITLGYILIISSSMIFGQKIVLEGSIVDESNMAIPYVSVTVPETYKGTTSTNEGTFYLKVEKGSLDNILEFSSIGFESFKISIKDFIEKSEKKIIMKENVAVLDEVTLLKPEEYSRIALEKLKETTISDSHQLKVLYRRSSVEDGVVKFFVEHYMYLLDKGPSTQFIKKMQVIEGRLSADYRSYPGQQDRHAIYYMPFTNPLRGGKRHLKGKKWNKVGDTSYDGEDVLILKSGTDVDYLKLYVGLEDNAIYKVETPRAVWMYKKNREGKLYLSYHNRIAESRRDLTPDELIKRKRVGLPYKKDILFNNLHEVFVLEVVTDKKKIKVKNYGAFGLDVGDIKVKYNPDFWNDFALPPVTEYFKKTRKDLESHFGVPLDTQFIYSSHK